MEDNTSIESPLNWADLDSLIESAPKDERIHLKRAVYRIKQLRLSKEATSLLPEKIRRYCLPQYGDYGEFKRFVCVACNEWLEAHHAYICPLNDLIPTDFCYSVINELIDSYQRDI